MTELYKSIREMKVLSDGTTIGESGYPSRRHLTFQRGKPIRVEYLFEPGRLSPDSTALFGPALNQSYFVLPGRAFLVYPDFPEHDNIAGSIEWKNFPETWNLADSLGVTGSCRRAGNLLKLSNGLFVGGDFRVIKAPLAGESAYVAVRGNWQFTDAAFAELAARVIAAEREFWKDDNSFRYLVALVPLDAPSGEYGGTAVENSFLMSMSPGTQLDGDVRFVLAHEMFHTWNPAQLGELRQNPAYWFSEGLTDYYARLLLLRASLINREEYANEVNRAYFEYMTSPARNYSEKVVQAQYFAEPAAQKLPYLQGSLLALKWNVLIAEHTGGRQSLDDAMRALRGKAKATEQVLSDQYLASFFSGFGGAEIVSDIRDYIGLGRTLPLPERAMGACYRVGNRYLYIFDAGFDVEAIYQTGVIRGVKEESEAYKAGLRNGQTVIRSSAINPNDTNQFVEMTVAESGQPKLVRYYPRVKGPEVDQYELIPNANNPSCQVPTSQ